MLSASTGQRSLVKFTVREQDPVSQTNFSSLPSPSTLVGGWLTPTTLSHGLALLFHVSRSLTTTVPRWDGARWSPLKPKRGAREKPHWLPPSAIYGSWAQGKVNRSWTKSGTFLRGDFPWVESTAYTDQGNNLLSTRLSNTRALLSLYQGSFPPHGPANLTRSTSPPHQYLCSR